MLVKIRLEDAILGLLQNLGEMTLDQIFTQIEKRGGCKNLDCDRLKKALENLGKANKTVFVHGMYSCV